MSWALAGAILGSSILGGIAQGINASAASHDEYKYAKRLMKYQHELNQDYATWSAQELPALNRAGLESAGFNPLLALSDGTGTSGNASIPGLPSAGSRPVSSAFQAIASAMPSAIQAFNTSKSLEMQEKLINSKVIANEATAERALDDIKHPGNLFKSLEKHVGEGSPVFNLLENSATKVFQAFDKLLKNVSNHSSQNVYINQSSDLDRFLNPHKSIDFVDSNPY